MSSSKFALFVDLENCGAKVDTLLSVLEKVKIRGDILLGKVYGYTDQYSDLKEVLPTPSPWCPACATASARKTTQISCW